MKISDKARRLLNTSAYHWRSHNVKTGATEVDAAMTFDKAKEQAAEAHSRLGFKHVVTSIAGPRGARWSYVPAQRSQMKWERQ